VARNAFPQPTASFTFSPAAPHVGTAVKFRATAHDSDDTALTFHWTFPDGTTSTLANPAHAFGTAGAKIVTLVVVDPHGDQVRVTHTVNVT
jgi:microbial collagenase